MHLAIINVDVFNVMQESLITHSSAPLTTRMPQKYVKINFRRLDFQIDIDPDWSLSLSKGIKKADPPFFYDALFACEEAA